jgi:hypothetical protein
MNWDNIWSIVENKNENVSEDKFWEEAWKQGCESQFAARAAYRIIKIKKKVNEEKIITDNRIYPPCYPRGTK